MISRESRASLGISSPPPPLLPSIDGEREAEEDPRSARPPRHRGNSGSEHVGFVYDELQYRRFVAFEDYLRFSMSACEKLSVFENKLDSVVINNLFISPFFRLKKKKKKETCQQYEMS
ncbi:hypothetical protein P5V15_006262 [Pogonomyrmex californicus]